ncbi:MAG: hypothetical protein VX498_15800, partial [Myxococcota bacterium]|nr:hypothetical protein [Myxococcota bacterium]
HQRPLPLFGSSFGSGEPRKGMRLYIDRRKTGGGKNNRASWRWRIRLWSPIPPTLTARREGDWTRWGQKLFGADVQAGLELFDEAFLLKGLPELEILALLSHRTRKALWTTVLEHGGRIDDGEVRDWAFMGKHYWFGGEEHFWFSGETGASQELVATLHKRAEDMMELAEAIAERSGAPATHLLHHSFEDPEPAFRHRCFEALTRQLPDTPEAHEARRRGAASTDPALRLLVELDRQDPNLELVGKLLREGGLSPALKARALACLGRQEAGSLSLQEEPMDGALSVSETAREGALSSPAKAARKKQTQ